MAFNPHVHYRNYAGPSGNGSADAQTMAAGCLMKALFCHDHHYYRVSGGVLSQGQYHNSVWQRYLDHFDALTVVGRDGVIPDPERQQLMNTASREGVSFELLENTNSLSGLFKRKTARETIRLLVADHDVIILRGVSEIGSMAYREAKRQGKPIAMEMVACAWDELWYHGSAAAKLYAPLRFVMARQMAKNTNAIIYVSQKFLQNRYPSNATIQAAASNVQVDANAFSNTKPPQRDYFKIGLIGTLKNKLKGVHIAIKAAQILKNKGVENFKIHILGPGNAESGPCHFAQMVRDCDMANMIIFDGIRQSGEPVLEWIRDLNIYIQPSLQEGVPRAVIEAMSQSRAIIGSNAGGIPELLDGVCIVPRGDANALANKIEWLMKNPDIQKDMAKKNFSEAQQYKTETLWPIRNQFWSDVANLALQYQTR